MQPLFDPFGGEQTAMPWADFNPPLACLHDYLEPLAPIAGYFPEDEPEVSVEDDDDSPDHYSSYCPDTCREYHERRD